VPPIMSTMLDESFSKGCSVGASTPDYGYGDTTAPDTARPGCVSIALSDLGYGSTDSNNEYGYANDNSQKQEQQRRRERPRRRGSITKYSLDAQHEVQQEYQTQQPHAAPADVKEINFDPTGLGYDDAVLSLNDEPPTPSGRIRKSRKSQQSDSSDASGTSNTSADKYGYGDTSIASTDKYGYGDTSNTSEDKYGYGETNDLGYGDANAQDRTASGQSTDSQRHRPRRRGSVTKFSLEEATATVADEYQDQPAPLLQQEYHVCSRPMSTEESMSYHDGSKSCDDDDAMSHDDDAEDDKKKKRKGGRFSRLRHSLSHSSKESHGSKDSN
jgi:hypothetical protein